ncbi:hypothetical protein FRC11_011349, partial [Ceratobasidium sp. 423]
MSDSQSEYEQQLFGTVSSAASLLALLAPITQASRHFVAKYKPDPAEKLSKVQKELDSFNLLLDREKHIIDAKTLEEFEKRYMRIQFKIQKENDRISQSSWTRAS